MTSKISNTLADNEKHKHNHIINRNISELWNDYKKFKSKFHAHNMRLEQFTLKVLKLSFFSNPQLKKSNNPQKSKYLKTRKINIKGQLALIKKAISIHLRSLQIEQRLYEENQFLKELLNNSYKVIIKEKNSSAIEIYEIKNIKLEERCFKSGLEYIFHELEDVSNKTKLKTKQILDAGNNDSVQLQYINDSAAAIEKLECIPTLFHKNVTRTGANIGKTLNVIPEVADSSEIEAEKPEKLQIDLDPSNSQYEILDVSESVNHNIETILQNISHHSLNAVIFDVKPEVSIEAVLDVKDTRDKKQVVQKTEVSSAKVQSIANESLIGIDIGEKVYAKSLKNIRTLIPNDSVLNYIALFFPLPFLLKKAFRYHDAAHARKKFDKFNLQKEIACIDLQCTNNKTEFKDECTGSGEGENVSEDDREDCLNLTEIKTVEFYDIPSSTDIQDYTVSWIEQQNERDFYYIKHPESMKNDTHTNSLPSKRKSIMKRSLYRARQDNFKDYLQNIITYSEEFYNKKDSNSTINSSETKRKRQREKINFPINSSAESKYAGKYKTKNILEHNANYSNYNRPKMPDMNKTYKIVFQQNMPQGFSLKFVKSKEKDVSTLIVSNRYPISKSSFPKARLYKK